MHEIVTLQLGNDANYIGTHFWNAQESYFAYDDSRQLSLVDPNILFRAGRGIGGQDTFSARTLIYDLKGDFGAMPMINELYREPQTPKNGYEVISAPRIEPSAYQTALAQGESKSIEKDQIRYWSDFNRIFYHPQSTRPIHDLALSSGLMKDFDDFALGQQLYEQESKEEGLMDRDVRKFAEECDQLQGFQVLSHATGGWAGFSAMYFTDLRDEYPKTTIWSWASESSDHAASSMKRNQQTLAFAKHLEASLANCSLHIPLVLPKTFPEYLSIDSQSKWHTSAIVSAALESMTLPSRVRDNVWSMTDMTEQFQATSARRIGKLDVVFPGYSMDPIDLSWLHRTDSTGHVYRSISCLRAPHSRLLEQLDPSAVFPLRYPILDSFPPIFKEPEKSVSVFTKMSADAGIRGRIREAQHLVRSLLRGDERDGLYETLQQEHEQWCEGLAVDESDESDD